MCLLEQEKNLPVATGSGQILIEMVDLNTRLTLRRCGSSTI